MSRIGSQAVITYKRMAWLEIKPGQSSRKTRKIKATYPLFEQCASMTKDPYWESVFIQMSRGKFPKWFSFSDNRLTYKKRKLRDYVVVPQKPDEAFKICVQFIRNKSTMMSETDRLNETRKINEIRSAHSDISSWKDITKSKIKDSLISAYILRVSKDLDLNIGQVKSLYALVNISLCLGQIDNNDIIMENNVIEHINGLVYNDELEFSLDEKHLHKTKKYKQKPFIGEEVYMDPSTKFCIQSKKNDIAAKWKSYTKKKSAGVFKGSSMVITGIPDS